VRRSTVVPHRPWDSPPGRCRARRRSTLDLMPSEGRAKSRPKGRLTLLLAQSVIGRSQGGELRRPAARRWHGKSALRPCDSMCGGRQQNAYSFGTASPHEQELGGDRVPPSDVSIRPRESSRGTRKAPSSPFVTAPAPQPRLWPRATRLRPERHSVCRLRCRHAPRQ
jgi:hypothetical protein